MKNKYIYILFIFIVLLIAFNNTVNAMILTLNVTSDKDRVNVNDEVVITVNWKEKMQAADFILNYDKNKFEFINCDIDDTFYKNDDSKVRVAWFSIDNKDKTEITFKFKAIKSGNARFNVYIDGGFATGNLYTPENYILNDIYVNVNKTAMETIFIAMFVIVILGIIIGIFRARKRK